MMREGGSNQMLVDLCFCMRLHDEKGDCNQMLLELRSCMRLHDERGVDLIPCSCSYAFVRHCLMKGGSVLIKCCWPFAFVCCNMTLHDKSGGFKSHAPGTMLLHRTIMASGLFYLARAWTFS